MGFLAMPGFVLASENNYQTFSEIETKKILENSIKHVYTNWQDYQASGDFDATKKTVLSFIKTCMQFDLWNYLFGDLPAETAVTLSKEAINLAQILNSENPVGGIIGLMESQTVKQAVKTATDYLFQKEMKVAFGAMRVQYNTGKAKVDTELQYIMVYKPQDDKSGELIIRIYSPQEIEPPVSHGSVGMSIGFLNDMPAGQKIPPFIAEIRGKVKATGFLFDRDWIESPAITLSFPKKVPDFNLKPKSWWNKYVDEPLSKTLSSFTDVINLFLPAKSQVSDYIAYNDEEESPNTGKINNEISKIAESQPSQTNQANPVNSQPENKTIQKTSSSKDSKAKKQTKTNSQVLENPKNISTDYSNLSDEERRAALIKILEEYRKRLFPETESNSEPNNNQNQEPTNNQNQEAVVLDKSACLINNLFSPKQNKVIINEVAWMGTTESASDEWIELKNISSQKINLAGWSLVNASKKIDIVFSSEDNIASAKFFLMERADDNSVPEKSADLIYSGALANTNEALYLFDANCELQDIIKAEPKWPAGDSETKRTMERGLSSLVWYTYGGGEDDIMGTPKAENSNTNWLKPVPSGGGSAGGSSSSNNNSNNTPETIVYCSQNNLGAPTHSPVVINEVAWMGTNESASDEWIELKNISSESVNLNKWQLLDKDSQIKISFANTDLIEPGGFYLLERTDDNSVPNVSANKIYSGSLGDTDESLRLFNSSCVLIDEAAATSDWPAGDKTAKKTMERDSNLAGWHTYLEIVADSDSGLMGTPKKENTQSAVNNQPEENQEENEEQLDDFSTIAITDLFASAKEGIKNSIILSWAAVPEAVDYEIYYSIGNSIDVNNLHNITDYESITLGVPGENNKIQVELSDLYWNSHYYFAVKAKNEQGVYSALSNVVEFQIGTASHQRAFIYGDFGHSGKITENGATNGDANSEVFIAGLNESDSDEYLYSPPVINENGDIIFKGRIDGKSGIYCFNKDGAQKWFFEIAIGMAPSILSADGTIYGIDNGFLYALAPNGKLKWKDGLSRFYNEFPALSPDGFLYILTDINSSPNLVKVTDNKDNTITKQNIYDISASLGGESIVDSSEIIFDNQGNLYFGAHDTLFGFNSAGQKILEKKIEVAFADDYQKSGNESTFIKELSLSGEILLFNAMGGYCQLDGGCRNRLYAFNKNNFEAPLWVKTIGNLLGASSAEAYYKERVPTWTATVVILHALGLEDGAEKWNKSSGGASDISAITIDNENRIYLSHGSMAYGFIPSQIVDGSWESGQVFSSYNMYNGNVYPPSIGLGAMYFQYGSKIYKIAY